jgi:hypothetical protein
MQKEGDALVRVITGSSNETLAILQNVVSPVVSEAINREFEFSFSTVIDNDKSAHVNYQNKVEVEDNYFQIVYTEEQRTEAGLFINAQCEHVSYSLISASLTAGFTSTGLFSAVATTLLSGTGFTVGTNQITASETISINESTNKRQVLMQLAALYDGELKFDKYTINLLTRRGADRGVQFRYRKNLVDVSRIVDNRKKVAGLPTIAYKVNAAELEFEQGFIDDGVSSLEHYELGDTIKVIDEDLTLEVSLRIVKELHDTEQRMQGTVEIGNFVDDLTDTITQIQTTSVAKDNIYNGCSIGPDNGFVATRSDDLVQTSMNATNGIEIDLRQTTTASYTPVFYVQVDTATGTANLYLAGNAVFIGTVNASTIIGSQIFAGGTSVGTAPFSVTTSGAVTADNLLLTGGVITIGTSNNTFRFTETDGLWMGNTTFSSAPFRVTMSGSATANDLTLTGGRFNVGTGTNTLQFNTTDGLFLGSTSASTAPFKASMSGAVTATDITMTGSSTITGGTITGGTIRTSVTGERIVLTDDSLKTYNSSGNLNGPTWGSAGNTYGDISLYDDGTEVLRIENALAGQGFSFIPLNGALTVYVDPVFTGSVQGAGTKLSYDTATNTLTLLDGNSTPLSSVIIP